MEKNQNNKPEVLATLDRRFQFTMLLALFFPFVVNNLQKVAPAFLNGHDNMSILIISYTFLSYFLFDLLRDNIKTNKLDIISHLLVIFSYSLIVVISFSSFQPNILLSGWKLILLGISLVVMIISPLPIITILALDPIIIGINKIIVFFKKNSKDKNGK